MAEFDGNSDELMQRMLLDEADDATKLKPIKYGKLRGIQPQLVYYHIRQGHIKTEQCLCGDTVIDVDAADEYFQKGKYLHQNGVEDNDDN
jgi:hypothetical protein